MKKVLLKKILCSNAPLKAVALTLGYSFWHILGHGNAINIWLEMPLSFYEVPEHVTLHAPDTVAINLTGKRSDFYNLDKNKLAVHINAHKLLPGYNNISITAETLLLPDTIKLIDYKPSNILIEVKKKTMNTTTKYNNH